MQTRTAARLLAGGRIAIGLALTLAPRQATGGWVGPEMAAQPGVQVLARAVGIRDLIMGLVALHTVDHPQIGARWVAVAAAADAVDVAATLAARSGLPRSAVITAAGSAGVGAIAGAVVAARL